MHRDHRGGEILERQRTVVAISERHVVESNLPGQDSGTVLLDAQLRFRFENRRHAAPERRGVQHDRHVVAERRRAGEEHAERDTERDEGAEREVAAAGEDVAVGDPEKYGHRRGR